MPGAGVSGEEGKWSWSITGRRTGKLDPAADARVEEHRWGDIQRKSKSLQPSGLPHHPLWAEPNREAADDAESQPQDRGADSRSRFGAERKYGN